MSYLRNIIGCITNFSKIIAPNLNKLPIKSKMATIWQAVYTYIGKQMSEMDSTPSKYAF